MISQLQSNIKTKQRSFSRAYETPKNNSNFIQYSGNGGRKTGTKGVSTGNATNGRRINQTIEIGATIEEIDIDHVISPIAPQHKTI